MKHLLKTLTFLLALPIYSHASEGVLEINQTCAVHIGCFEGDTPGFPVTINKITGLSRNFTLTSDLVIASINTSAIEITTSNVSIDLHGFSISGVLCTLSDNNCTPANSGTASGIKADTDYHNVSVKNGNVVGLAHHGIELWGKNSTVENVTAKWNKSIGIRAGDFAKIVGNIVIQNGDKGILVQSAAIVNDNVVGLNIGDGIFSNNAVIVKGNTVYENLEDGIDVFNGSFVKGNSAYNNVGYGLRLTSSTAYSDNVLISNDEGSVTGGINTGANVCGPSTICP